jgi:kynurenine formamidase
LLLRQLILGPPVRGQARTRNTCDYLAERKIILTGADTWAVEAVGKDSGGETPQPFECHIKMQTKRGIWNLENLDPAGGGQGLRIPVRVVTAENEGCDGVARQSDRALLSDPG